MDRISKELRFAPVSRRFGWSNGDVMNQDFTIGIEEEYLLVDRETLDLAEAPEGLMAKCQAALRDQVSPEFLQCQIEVGTQVCTTVADARADLGHLRRTVRDCAAEFGLAPIAASCHPFADWKQQTHTDKDRYNELERSLRGVVRRLLICGMHVHVGIEDPELRIDLVNQMTYFLPHLLALSTSSPFWQGEDTGLSSYRLTVFDNLPRTGLPPRFESWPEYERTVAALVDLDLIEDSSKIWWDLRPSARFPTIESRICDVQPRLEHTLSIAAATQCIARMLWRLRRANQRWRLYDNFLVEENRWRAQRFGAEDGLVDFGARQVVAMSDLVEEIIDLTSEDAEALDCVIEMNNLRDIVQSGTSAERQRSAFANAQEAGADSHEALSAVALHLVQEFSLDL